MKSDRIANFLQIHYRHEMKFWNTSEVKVNVQMQNPTIRVLAASCFYTSVNKTLIKDFSLVLEREAEENVIIPRKERYSPRQASKGNPLHMGS